MTYQIKMMSGEKLFISEETFNKLAGQTGLIHIKELNAIINLNSVSTILPSDIVDSDRKQNRDGQWCIKKFSRWYLENSPETKVDLNYYPELREQQKKDLYKLQRASNIAKKMIENGNF